MVGLLRVTQDPLEFLPDRLVGEHSAVDGVPPFTAELPGRQHLPRPRVLGLPRQWRDSSAGSQPDPLDAVATWPAVSLLARRRRRRDSLRVEHLNGEPIRQDVYSPFGSSRHDTIVAQ
jgi:hypothetical protein